MLIWVNTFFWGLGLTAFTLAALYGLSEGALWLLDRLLKSLGIWPLVWKVMCRAYREKRDEVEPGAR